MTGLADGFQGRGVIVQQRDELLAVQVVYPNIAGRNGVDPTIEVDVPLAELEGNGGVCAQMIQLGSDILLGCLNQASLSLEVRVVFSHEAAGRFCLPDLFFNSGKNRTRLRDARLHDGPSPDRTPQYR